MISAENEKENSDQIEEMKQIDKMDQFIEEDYTLIDEGKLEFNHVRKNNKFLYHEQTSNLKNNKGRPVVDQVTPFHLIQNDENWNLPFGPPDEKARKGEADILQKRKVDNQSMIISALQNIDTQNDLIAISKENYEKDFCELAKSIQKDNQRRLQEDKKSQLSIIPVLGVSQEESKQKQSKIIYIQPSQKNYQKSISNEESKSRSSSNNKRRQLVKQQLTFRNKSKSRSSKSPNSSQSPNNPSSEIPANPFAQIPDKADSSVHSESVSVIGRSNMPSNPASIIILQERISKLESSLKNISLQHDLQVHPKNRDSGSKKISKSQDVPLQKNNSNFDSEVICQDQLHLISDIKKIVQKGGNNCLMKFDSFGEQKEDNISHASSSIQAASNHQSNPSIQNCSFVKNPPIVLQLENDSGFSRKILAKESELLSQNFSSQMFAKKSLKISPVQKKEEEKVYKDSQFNHSKIIRQIEQMLKDLMIDFNFGLIIQMPLKQKLDLKTKLIAALNNREKLHQNDYNFNHLGPIKQHLSDNDLHQDELNLQNNQNLIQQQRHNHYMKKAAVRYQQKFVKKMSSGLKINKMLAFEADYDFYFQNNQGMFVVQSQLKYVDLNKIKRKKNLSELLQNVQYFEDMRIELLQEDINWGQKTLCIDIENIFVRKVNIMEFEELNLLREISKFQDYIVVHKSYQRSQSDDSDQVIDKVNMKLESNQNLITELVQNYCEIKSNGEEILSEEIEVSNDCCILGLRGKNCICGKDIYQIRPYTLEILRAIQPFFEIIAMSNLPYNELEQIIDFIELILNKPITEMLIKQAEERKMNKAIDCINKSMGSQSSNQSKNKQNKKKRKRVKKIEPKIFFQFLVSKTNYIFLPEVNEYIENLFLLTKNRKPANIFLITSNQFRIVQSMDAGFCSIPVVKFQAFMQSDYQLNLLENYLVKLKYSQDMKSKNQKDFGYLTQNSAINKMKQVQDKSDPKEWEQDSFGGGSNGFQQLSQNMDCVIEEEKNESSKKNTSSSQGYGSDKFGIKRSKSGSNDSSNCEKILKRTKKPNVDEKGKMLLNHSHNSSELNKLVNSINTIKEEDEQDQN